MQEVLVVEGKGIDEVEKVVCSCIGYNIVTLWDATATLLARAEFFPLSPVTATTRFLSSA